MVLFYAKVHLIQYKGLLYIDRHKETSGILLKLHFYLINRENADFVNFKNDILLLKMSITYSFLNQAFGQESFRREK